MGSEMCIRDSGHALHLTPGILHAYLSGDCIEVMGNSDNVLRGGLTKKHIDPGALVQVVNFEPGMPEIHEPTEIGQGLACYDVNEESFQLCRVQPIELMELPATNAPRVLLVWEGDLTLIDDQDEVLKLSRGQAAFLAAGECVRVRGEATCYLVSPGHATSL